MLIEFRVSNFLSFSSEQHFTFANSSDRAHQATHTVRTSLRTIPSLSKAAVILGPNGSGKSNFISALATLRTLVLHSTSLTDEQYRQCYTPNRLLPSGLSVEFEIELYIDLVRYRYSIAYNSRRITFEKLEVYKTVKSQRWFERAASDSTNDSNWASFSPNFNGPREMWRQATRPRALFLTTASQLNSLQLKPLVHWFQSCLEIIIPSDHEDSRWIGGALGDSAHKNHLVELFNSVDIPIADIRVRKPISASDAPSPHEEIPVVEFKHQTLGADGWVDPRFEATGVTKLFRLFTRLIKAIKGEKLLVVDEFDSSLHPLVARYLIEIITRPDLKRNRTQLLLTTHNAMLMDLNILRRDEIWLTTPDESGATSLYPVSSRGARKQGLIMKGYLRGRFGGIPRIRTLKTAERT